MNSNAVCLGEIKRPFYLPNQYECYDLFRRLGNNFMFQIICKNLFIERHD